MKRPFRLFLSVVLVVIMVLGSSYPAFAPELNPDLVGEPTEINVTAGSTFTLNVWIKNIPTGKSMIKFRFYVTWDYNYMDLIGWDNLADDRGWHINVDNRITTTTYQLWAESRTQGGSPWSPDAIWTTLTFRCKQEGSSNIYVKDSLNTNDTVWLVNGEEIKTNFDPYIVPCNQRPPPTHRSHPIGGDTLPVNQLAVLAPYLTLIGLIATTSTVYLVKKRRNS